MLQNTKYIRHDNSFETENMILERRMSIKFLHDFWNGAGSFYFHQILQKYVLNTQGQIDLLQLGTINNK